jgi:hypothetical protein
LRIVPSERLPLAIETLAILRKQHGIGPGARSGVHQEALSLLTDG